MNDYLWDPSDTPEPDIQRLEALLRPLQTRRTAPPLPAALRPTRWLTPRFLVPALGVAAGVLLMVGATWQSSSRSAAWTIDRLSGDPRVDSSSIGAGAHLVVGQAVVTDAASRARIDVDGLGEVTVDANSRVRLVESGSARHRLALDHGTLRAIIVAPPGQFVVDTPSARATDLGCAYTLHVDEDGLGLLSVQAGWVAFEYNGRESFVPAGASCRTVPRDGPGTPRFDDSEQAFQDSLDEVDFGGDSTKTGASLDYVLRHARPRDAMTLWHLISRVDAAPRGAVVDALAARLPMPKGVGRDAVMRLDRASLDAWWNALGLDDASWWRTWKRAYPR
ncbi:MAG TPA: FecR domain-containing protein [Vicinamibacterales bacterium]|nr:FecR domain-containing protein [Vicinamibacterales bacterium]